MSSAPFKPLPNLSRGLKHNSWKWTSLKSSLCSENIKEFKWIYVQNMRPKGHIIYLAKQTSSSQTIFFPKIKVIKMVINLNSLSGKYYFPLKMGIPFVWLNFTLGHFVLSLVENCPKSSLEIFLYLLAFLQVCFYLTIHWICQLACVSSALISFEIFHFFKQCFRLLFHYFKQCSHLLWDISLLEAVLLSPLRYWYMCFFILSSVFVSFEMHVFSLF